MQLMNDKYSKLTSIDLISLNANWPQVKQMSKGLFFIRNI